MEFTFTVPAGTSKVQPALEIIEAAPEKALLVALELPGLTQNEANNALRLYAWSQKLNSHYHYLTQASEFPYISDYPEITLPDTGQPLTLRLQIKSWGTNGPKPHKVIGRVALSYTSPFGEVLIYPDFSAPASSTN